MSNNHIDLKKRGRGRPRLPGPAGLSKLQRYRWRLRKVNPEKLKEQDRRANLKRTFKITPEEYDRLFNSQNHICPACGLALPLIETENRNSRPPVDHDHVTGKIRGIGLWA